MLHNKMKCYLCYNIPEESNRTYLGLGVVVTAAFHGFFLVTRKLWNDMWSIDSRTQI
jgi:hypothetical protein